MKSLKLACISYSLSHQPSSLEGWKESLVREIDELYSNGARIILYPELFLAGLGLYFSETDEKKQLRLIGDFIWNDFLKELELKLPKDLLLVLGSGPKLEDDFIYNSAPVWINGRWIAQSKIHLTPWETSFTPGQNIFLLDFFGLKTAVVICFDIEQPGLALQLKEAGVDLILVPSATTNLNGNQRVNRCASARSIELGAAVLTSPLVGDSKVDLIDHNEGRQGFFLPAQEAIKVEQEEFSAYSIKEHVVKNYFLDLNQMALLKLHDTETRPYFKRDSKVKIISR